MKAVSVTVLTDDELLRVIDEGCDAKETWQYVSDHSRKSNGGRYGRT